MEPKGKQLRMVIRRDYHRLPSESRINDSIFVHPFAHLSIIYFFSSFLLGPASLTLLRLKRREAANKTTNNVPSKKPTHNSHWPLLPLTVPVERDRYGAQPSTDNAAPESAHDLVERRAESADGFPRVGADAVGIEDGEHGEDGEGCGAE